MIRLKLETKIAPEGWSECDTKLGIYTWYLGVHLWHIRSALKQYRPVHWKVCLFPRWASFFNLLGCQNDYLFPGPGREGTEYPFDKPHWWKTRIGFRTAWDLTSIIHSKD